MWPLRYCSILGHPEAIAAQFSRPFPRYRPLALRYRPQRPLAHVQNPAIRFLKEKFITAQLLHKSGCQALARAARQLRQPSGQADEVSRRRGGQVAEARSGKGQPRWPRRPESGGSQAAKAARQPRRPRRLEGQGGQGAEVAKRQRQLSWPDGLGGQGAEAARRPSSRESQAAEAASRRESCGRGASGVFLGASGGAPRCFWKLGACSGWPSLAAQDGASIGKHAVIVARGRSGSG